MSTPNHTPQNFPRPSHLEADILVGVERITNFGDEGAPNPAVSAIANNPPDVVTDARLDDMTDDGAGESELSIAYRELELERIRRRLPKFLRISAAALASVAFVGLFGALKYTADSGSGREYAPLVPGNSIGFDPHNAYLPTLVEKDPKTDEVVYNSGNTVIVTGLGAMSLLVVGAAAVSSNGASYPKNIQKDAQKIQATRRGKNSRTK